MLWRKLREDHVGRLQRDTYLFNLRETGCQVCGVIVIFGNPRKAKRH